MAKLKYRVKLSIDGINDLIGQLNEYKDITLPNKIETFIEKLAERGIKVAERSIYSDYSGNIHFEYRPEGNDSGSLVGFSSPIHARWYKKNGALSGEYDIDPIAMAEFGAGWYASTNPWDSVPSLRGSLGENGNKDIWYWYDANGQKHSSDDDYKINPTRPMYNAYLEMIKVYREVAQEVFGYE